MFFVNLESLIEQKGNKRYFKVPVIALFFDSYWCEETKRNIDPNHKVTVFKGNDGLYALVKIDEADELREKCIAQKILSACGDPARIF